MSKILISRHPAAIEWVKSKISLDKVIAHLTQKDLEELTEQDTVIGTLPINLAAQVCAQGAKFIYLSLNTPVEFRGQELTPEQMEKFGAKLEPYLVIKHNKL